MDFISLVIVCHDQKVWALKWRTTRDFHGRSRHAETMPGKPVAMDPRAEVRVMFVVLEGVIVEIISSNCKDGRIPERHCVVIFCFFERLKSNFGLTS